MGKYLVHLKNNFSVNIKAYPWLPQIIGLVVLLSFSVLIRIPFFNIPMISDEGGYAYVARFWTDSYQLYRDIPFDRPQGIFLIYKLILNFIGGDVGSIRLAAALWNAITLVFLYLLTREVFNQKAAYVSAAVFAIISTSPSIEGFTANAELFAVLPLTIAAYLTWRQKWVWAGFASGIAVLIKPIGISGLALVLLWMVVVRVRLKTVILVLAAFTIPQLVSISHGVFIDRDSYWSSSIERALGHTVVSVSPGRQLILLFFAALQTLPVWIPPAALAIIGSSKAPNRGRIFGILWIISSLLGMAIGGNWYWQYFTQLIPPLAFLSGTIVFALKGYRWRIIQVVFLGVALSVFVVREVPHWFSSPQEVSWELYQRPSYIHAANIVSYIDSTTDTDDLIYVAFAEAEIYYLSQRRAAVPQLYMYDIVGSQSLYDDVLTSIQAREPTLVIWVQEPPQGRGTAEEFQFVLSESGYFEDARFGDTRVFKRPGE